MITPQKSRHPSIRQSCISRRSQIIFTSYPATAIHFYFIFPGDLSPQIPTILHGKSMQPLYCYVPKTYRHDALTIPQTINDKQAKKEPQKLHQSLWGCPCQGFSHLMYRNPWSSRRDRIWTCDLCVPNAALYQAEPRADLQLPNYIITYTYICLVHFYLTFNFPWQFLANTL